MQVYASIELSSEDMMFRSVLIKRLGLILKSDSDV